jgi:hypothetical protein
MNSAIGALSEQLIEIIKAKKKMLKMFKILITK